MKFINRKKKDKSKDQVKEGGGTGTPPQGGAGYNPNLGSVVVPSLSHHFDKHSRSEGSLEQALKKKEAEVKIKSKSSLEIQSGGNQVHLKQQYPQQQSLSSSQQSVQGQDAGEKVKKNLTVHIPYKREMNIEMERPRGMSNAYEVELYSKLKQRETDFAQSMSHAVSPFQYLDGGDKDTHHGLRVDLNFDGYSDWYRQMVDRAKLAARQVLKTKLPSEPTTNSSTGEVMTETQIQHLDFLKRHESSITFTSPPSVPSPITTSQKKNNLKNLSNSINSSVDFDLGGGEEVLSNNDSEYFNHHSVTSSGPGFNQTSSSHLFDALMASQFPDLRESRDKGNKDNEKRINSSQLSLTKESKKRDTRDEDLINSFDTNPYVRDRDRLSLEDNGPHHNHHGIRNSYSNEDFKSPISVKKIGEKLLSFFKNNVGARKSEIINTPIGTSTSVGMSSLQSSQAMSGSVTPPHINRTHSSSSITYSPRTQYNIEAQQSQQQSSSLPLNRSQSQFTLQSPTTPRNLSVVTPRNQNMKSSPPVLSPNTSYNNLSESSSGNCNNSTQSLKLGVPPTVNSQILVVPSDNDKKEFNHNPDFVKNDEYENEEDDDDDTRTSSTDLEDASQVDSRDDDSENEDDDDTDSEEDTTSTATDEYSSSPPKVSSSITINIDK